MDLGRRGVDNAAMAKTFRPYEPDQLLLMPPALADWVPEDHLARFVSDVVDDARPDGDRGHLRRGAGVSPVPPADDGDGAALRLRDRDLLVAEDRPRGWSTDVAFRFLAAEQPAGLPDDQRLPEAAQRGAGRACSPRCCGCAGSAGLVKLGQVAIDGTRIKANASKHKAMSYGRMAEKEAALQAEIAELLRRAEQADRDEDARYGADRRGDELPAELARRESRLQKIREAKAALEAEAREQAAQAGKDPAQATPAPKAQRNFTDPESKIQKTADGFIQGYNAQAAVDAHAQVIVAQDVTPMAADVGRAAAAGHGDRSDPAAAADAGAGRRRAIAPTRTCKAWRDKGIDAYIATGPADARRMAGPRAAGAPPGGPDAPRAHGPEAADVDRARGVRPAQGDRRAGVRADQTRATLPAVSPTRLDGRASRVGADLHGAQPAEAAHDERRPMSAAAAPPHRARGAVEAGRWSSAWLPGVDPHPSATLAHLLGSRTFRPIAILGRTPS